MNPEMETLETIGNPEEGNTKPLPGRVVPGKYWCFTWNNYPSTGLETLETIFKSLGCEYVVGKEVGENGTPHLQGWISCKTKIRPLEKFKIKEIHWEKCMGTREQNITYCSKGGDYISNVRINKPLQKGFVPDWATSLHHKLTTEEPDCRTIHWCWESVGNTGKSQWARNLVIEHGAIMTAGKAADMKYQIQKYIEQNDGVWPTIIIFDVPRTSQEYVSYQGIEEIKNGVFAATKYESGMVTMNPPHVVILANFDPDKNKISEDRWDILNIGGHGYDLPDYRPTGLTPFG